MNKEGDLTQGVGRGVEGSTLQHTMYIHKRTRRNHYAEHEREGRGRERGGFEGGLNEQCACMMLLA